MIDTIKEPEGLTLLGGKPVVSFLIYKEPEANTIQVTRRSRPSAESALRKTTATSSINHVYRDADYVRASFSSLAWSLVVGAGLAFLVLFLFLNDIRSPLVVGVAIPVSLLITFVFLYMGKVKLNLMSLGGLSFAAGLLVDNAIVVIENINRHIEEKLVDKEHFDPHDMETRRIIAQAAELGTREMGNAVIACTLTTVAVFLPVVYVPGVAGRSFATKR